MAFKNPNDLGQALLQEPFKLDKEKYPDVEETPYGFIYNVNGKSITDVLRQNQKFGLPGKSGGFTLAVDGDEIFYPDWESAYKAAKGVK